MRIGCLQFAPQVGDVSNNLNRADALLSKANPENLDLLVLPELAFTGYNFKSLSEISPYLEPTCAGITSLWARTTALKYNCVVVAGYPEKVDVSQNWPTDPQYYNSALAVNADGETILNYRKTHLYYTDETWALEGTGFHKGYVPGLGRVAMGICMDLNPCKFEAPWSAFEFGFHALNVAANVVILSMAWLTREDPHDFSRMPKKPDMETLTYWVTRLEPLIRAENQGEIIVIFANRTGVEGDAVYAGTSAVIGVQHGEVSVYGLLGRGEKELLVVDTMRAPFAKLVYRPESLSMSVAQNSSSHRVSLSGPTMDGIRQSALPDSRSDSRASTTSTSHMSVVQSMSGENTRHIFGEHALVSHDALFTPESASLSTTPFLELAPPSPHYLWLPLENLMPHGPAINASPTSSTRSNHSNSSDVRKGGLIKSRMTADTSTMLTPRDSRFERHKESTDLISTIRKMALSQPDDSYPIHSSPPKSRATSLNERGARSDPVGAQGALSVFESHAQNAISGSDSLDFRHDSPQPRNASRNQSRTGRPEYPNTMPDRQLKSSSRNHCRGASNAFVKGTMNREKRRDNVNESTMGDKVQDRYRSLSPDLDKIGADLIVFEEGTRRPKRDSLECHADEDDFIVLHASQKQQNLVKSPSHAAMEPDRPASRKTTAYRDVNSSGLSKTQSPRKENSSNLTQKPSDLSDDSRAVSRGRQHTANMSSPKSSTRHVPSTKSPTPFNDPEHILVDVKSPTGLSTRSKQYSKQARALTPGYILSSNAPSNDSSRGTSREPLANSHAPRASIITTVPTTPASKTPEALPPTPKAMTLSPNWDKPLPNIAPVVEKVSPKFIEQDSNRPRSAIW